MWLTTRTGTAQHAWRLHTQFHLDRHMPLRMDLTSGKNSGESDKRTALRRHLAADHLQVMDRWYAQFKPFDDIVAARSSYVQRCATARDARFLAANVPLRAGRLSQAARYRPEILAWRQTPPKALHILAAADSAQSMYWAGKSADAAADSRSA